MTKKIVEPRGVLIADDYDFIQKLVGHLLEDESGFEIVGKATTGVEAVEMYKSKRPDVVLMDIRMPDLDGIGALKSIIEYDPDANVIMVSGLNSDEIKQKCYKFGAKDFITKPFRAKDMLGMIKGVLPE